MELHICQSDLIYLKTADRIKVLQDIKDFGFTKVRFEVPFHAWTWSWKPYDWAPLRNLMTTMTQVGLAPLPVLGAHRPVFWRPTSAVYAKWCADAVYQLNCFQVVDQVEIWNEPNLLNFWPKADPVTFYPFAQAAYDAIKASRPSCEVVLAGMAAFDTGIQLPIIGGTKAPDDFVLTMLDQAKGKPFFDRLAYHPYNLNAGGKWAEPSALLFGIQMFGELDRMRPGVLVTEFGFTGPGDAKAADWLTKELALLTDAKEGYLYCWRDTQGEKFGLVNAKNQPKEPYYSYVKSLLK